MLCNSIRLNKRENQSLFWPFEYLHGMPFLPPPDVNKKLFARKVSSGLIFRVSNQFPGGYVLLQGDGKEDR